MTAVGTDYKVGDKVSSGWLPNGGTITQGFGTWEYLPEFGINQPHQGIDIAGKRGDPVTTPVNATVLGAGWDAFGGGNFVKLDLGNGTTAFLYHLQNVAVKAGQNVGPGELLGHMDSTGDSTGDHLHFQIDQGGTPTDPWSWITKAAAGITSGSGGPNFSLFNIQGMSDFFSHLITPGHSPCSPPADEIGVFKIIDAFTCPQNWWKALFVTVGVSLIGVGIFIYFFKEESRAAVTIIKTAEVAA